MTHFIIRQNPSKALCIGGPPSSLKPFSNTNHVESSRYIQLQLCAEMIIAYSVCIDQLRRERLSLGWLYKAIITTNVLVVDVNFGGHFGGQNVQVSMLQNGMVMSCVQSAEQIGSKRIVTGKLSNFLPIANFFELICSADCTQLMTIPFWSILTCTFCPPKWPLKLTPATYHHADKRSHRN